MRKATAEITQYLMTLLHFFAAPIESKKYVIAWYYIDSVCRTCYWMLLAGSLDGNFFRYQTSLIEQHPTSLPVVSSPHYTKNKLKTKANFLRSTKKLKSLFELQSIHLFLNRKKLDFVSKIFLSFQSVWNGPLHMVFRRSKTCVPL